MLTQFHEADELTSRIDAAKDLRRSRRHADVRGDRGARDLNRGPAARMPPDSQREYECRTLVRHSLRGFVTVCTLKRLLVITSIHLFSVAAAAGATRRQRRGAAGGREHRDRESRDARHRPSMAMCSAIPRGRRPRRSRPSGRSSPTKGSRRRSERKCGSCSPPTRSTSARCSTTPIRPASSSPTRAATRRWTTPTASR